MGQEQGEQGARSVLVVDDDETLLQLATFVLQSDGVEVTPVGRAEEAVGWLERRSFDLVVTDLRMPGMSGLELLGEVRRGHPDTPVVVVTAHGSIESAVEAMRAGAVDYVTKPISGDDLKLKVRRALRVRSLEAENRWLHAELAASWRPGRLVAVSAAMRGVVAMIEKLATSDATVLLTGESGTGKEVLARALHHGGARAAGPFVALNCAAIPAGLVESELFGHTRGSFTGASQDRPGKLELAHRGTLFLDEVGELPLETQPKLLRALQERVVERIGDQKVRRIDVRVIAATNRDLAGLVKAGKFREDLYYRLAVVPVRVPPLRDRRDDIPALTRFLLRRLAGDDAPEVSEDALAALTQRHWRGNVRELSNVIERVLALHSEKTEITADDLPPEGDELTPPAMDLRTPAPASPATGAQLVTLPADGAPLDDMVRSLLVQALERKAWNVSAAARLVRIPRHILQYRMQKLGIVPPGGGSNR